MENVEEEVEEEEKEITISTRSKNAIPEIIKNGIRSKTGEMAKRRRKRKRLKSINLVRIESTQGELGRYEKVEIYVLIYYNTP